MDCQRIQDFFSEYIDGSLDPRLATVVESHVERCEACATELGQLRRTVAVLRSVPPLTPPSYFVQAVRARIAEPRKKKSSALIQWLMPGRQGIAVRLLATAVLVIAIAPPIRRPVVSGAWGLVEAMGHHSVTISTPGAGARALSGSGAPRLMNSGNVSPGVSTATGGGTRPATGVTPEIPGTVPAPSSQSSQTPSSATSTGVIATLPRTFPIVHPSASPAIVEYTINGDRSLHSPIHVAVRVVDGRDDMNATIVAQVSPGLQLSSGGTTRRLWSGNLIAGLPTEQALQLSADRPGLYFARITVSAGGQSLAVSDLLLPIDLRPASMGDVSVVSASESLYDALVSVAAQSGVPIAVNEGLLGTAALKVGGRTPAALQQIASAFGCAVFEKDGISYVDVADVHHASA